MPSWRAASSSTASCACAAATAATTSWWRSSASGAAFARRAGPCAWPRRRLTWSTTSSRLCRCASGYSYAYRAVSRDQSRRGRIECATAPPTTRSATGSARSWPTSGIAVAAMCRDRGRCPTGVPGLRRGARSDARRRIARGRRGGGSRLPTRHPASTLAGAVPLRLPAGHRQRLNCAATAPQLIPRGKLGVSVWVQALLGKYLYGQPTHRLLQDWREQGLHVAQGR